MRVEVELELGTRTAHGDGVGDEVGVVVARCGQAVAGVGGQGSQYDGFGILESGGLVALPFVYVEVARLVCVVLFTDDGRVGADDGAVGGEAEVGEDVGHGLTVVAFGHDTLGAHLFDEGSRGGVEYHQLGSLVGIDSQHIVFVVAQDSPTYGEPLESSHVVELEVFGEVVVAGSGNIAILFGMRIVENLFYHLFVRRFLVFEVGEALVDESRFVGYHLDGFGLGPEAFDVEYQVVGTGLEVGEYEYTVILVVGGVSGNLLAVGILQNHGHVVERCIGVDRVYLVVVEVVFEAVVFVLHGTHDAALRLAVVAKPGPDGPCVAHALLLAIVFVEQALTLGLVGVEAPFAEESVAAVFQHAQIAGVAHVVGR